MIEVRNASVGLRSAGRLLVKDVSFSVGAGEMLAIIGANGAGKTTLLRLLCNDLAPELGEIRLDGKPLQEFRSSELARKRAVLSQHHTISLSFLVEELVLMGRYPHFSGQPGPEDLLIVRQAMAETGIAHLAGRTYSTLSGGEQQRVQLARVLAQVYDVPGGYLFLDEPVNGLDLLHQQQVLMLARDLANRGYCVVSILHDINLAGRYADKVLIMKGGEAIAFGDPLEVINCDTIHTAFDITVRLMPCEDFRCPLVIPLTV